MQSKKVRWAVLGTSFISDVMAAAIQESTISELVAIGSRSEEKGKFLADKFSVPVVHTDFQALLEDKNIDVVYIGLPNHLHKEFILRSAAAGKHVLCDKPFTLTKHDAEEAFAAAEKANVFCLEGLMYRYHPFAQKIHAIIQSGVIGDIKLIHAAYSANIAAFANPAEGGGIRNLGCYPLSLTRSIVGAEPVQFSALGRLSPQTKHDNQASIMMKFQSGAMAVVSCADDFEMVWQFEIMGSKGHISVVTNPWLPERENNRFIIYRDADQSSETIEVQADKSLFAYQIDAMSNKILGNQTIDFTEARKHSIGNAGLIAEWLKQVKAPVDTKLCA